MIQNRSIKVDFQADPEKSESLKKIRCPKIAVYKAEQSAVSLVSDGNKSKIASKIALIQSETESDRLRPNSFQMCSYKAPHIPLLEWKEDFNDYYYPSVKNIEERGLRFEDEVRSNFYRAILKMAMQAVQQAADLKKLSVLEQKILAIPVEDSIDSSATLTQLWRT